MERRTNALAELAETLKHHIEPRRLNADKDEFAVAICKVQRIVAELAKVEDVTESHNLKLVQKPSSWQCYDAIVNCRAIAEEGAGDGK